MWQQDVGVPGREVFDALCAAVEPLKTAKRQSWKVQNASLRQGQVETPLGLKDAGMALLATHAALDLWLRRSIWSFAG